VWVTHRLVMTGAKSSLECRGSMRCLLVLLSIASPSSFVWISAHNSEAQSSTIQPFDGLWHYLCASWTSSTSTVNLYLDVDQVVDTFKVSSKDDADSGSALTRDGCITIGQYVANSDSDCTLLEPGYSFEGYITDITLWAKNLNVSEVRKVAPPL
jgi:hypothetical protein